MYVFPKALNRSLPKRKGQLPYEVLDAVDLDSFRIHETYSGEIVLEAKDGALPSFGADATGMSDPEMDFLSMIVNALNKTYEINLTEEDKVDMQRMKQ